nr:classical arabinogalactan protein 9-like [Lolium perenne]
MKHRDTNEDDEGEQEPTAALKLSPSTPASSTIAGEGNPFPSHPGSRAPTPPANSSTRRRREHPHRETTTYGPVNLPKLAPLGTPPPATYPPSKPATGNLRSPGNASKEEATPMAPPLPNPKDFGFHPGTRAGVGRSGPQRCFKRECGAREHRHRRGQASRPGISPDPELPTPAPHRHQSQHPRDTSDRIWAGERAKGGK